MVGSPRFRILPLGLILLAAAIPLSALPAVPGSWSMLGPDGGSVYALASSPKKPQILLASTPGGVYKSVDGGATWRKTSLGNGPTVYTVYQIAVHPKFPETVLVATDQGLFQSNNGGARWKKLTRGLPPVPYTIGVSFDPVAPRRLYASILSSPSREMGLYRSLDGGVSWQPIHSGPMERQQVEALAVDRRNARSVGTLYAGTLTGLFKSSDDGRTWIQASGFNRGTVRSLAIHPTQRNVLYAGAAGGLFRSTNGGVTWIQLTQDLPRSGAFTAIITSPQHLQTLYVGVNGSQGPAGVFRSDDGGNSWALRSHGIFASNVVSLAVDEQNPDTIWIVADAALFRSVDRGRTWAPVPLDPALSASELRRVAVSPLDSKTVYLDLRSGSVVRSQDGGQTWRVAGIPDLPSDFTVLAADAEDPARLWIAGPGIARSLDGGDTWTVLPTGFGFFLSLAISPSSPSTIYALGTLTSRSLLVRSIDGGATWTAIQSGLSPDLNPSALAIDPLLPKTVYTLSLHGEVFKSADGGDTWTRVNDGSDGRLNQPLIITASGILYASVPGDTIYESDDGGETWAPLGNLHLPIAFADLAVDPQDPCRLYAATYGRGLLVFTKTGTCR